MNTPTKSRIELTDTGMSAVMKMAEGNPGALTVCCEILKRGEAIDPDAFMGGLGMILLMDTFRIYSHRIWMLYKDVCGQDLTKTLAVLRACQLGLADLDLVQLAIDGKATIDVDDYLNRVQEQLPAFGKATI